MDERAIIARAQGGDREAFGDLVRAYQARLRGYVARSVESSHEVYDIVQDAFLDALQNLGSFDPERAFYPWLRGICRHRMLNYFRSQRVRHSNGLALSAALEETITASEERHDVLERIEALKRCLGKLPEPHRDLVGLRYRDQVAVKELAVRLQRSAASISMQLYRIRTILEECMEQQLRLAHP